MLFFCLVVINFFKAATGVKVTGILQCRANVLAMMNDAVNSDTILIDSVKNYVMVK